MSRHIRRHSIDRRSFLTTLAAGAAAVTSSSLLAACGGEPSRSTTGGVTQGSQLQSVLPAYVPVEYVKPDLPSVNGSAPGYLTFPSELVKSVQSAPLSGGEFTAMTPAWWPAPKQPNAYFDEVNRRLGGTIKFTIVPGNDYKAKLAAVTAAGNVSDLTVITQWDQPARFGQAVGRLFHDLTPYLAGDKVKQYPNLANLPTAAWEMCVFDGKLMAVPFPESLFFDQLFYRKDILDELGEGPPADADELLELAKRVTDEKAGRWGTGDIWIEAQRLYNALADWQKRDGKLYSKYELPEFEEALAFARKFFDAGVIHPDVVAGRTDGVKELFESGKMLMYVDGLGAWHEAFARQAGNPSFDMRIFPPYAAKGMQPGYVRSDPSRIWCFISRKVPADRIPELLGALNLCAAPFGTEEHLLLEYGIEGTHFTRNADGVPQKNERGNAEVTYTYSFLAGRPDALTQVHLPKFVRARHAWEAEAARYQVKVPHFGLRVEEPARIAGRNGINQPVDDKVKDIYLGRAPVSDLKQAVQEWRRRGGDELRAFYEKVLADAGR